MLKTALHCRTVAVAQLCDRLVIGTQVPCAQGASACHAVTCVQAQDSSTDNPSATVSKLLVVCCLQKHLQPDYSPSSVQALFAANTTQTARAPNATASLNPAAISSANPNTTNTSQSAGRALLLSDPSDGGPGGVTPPGARGTVSARRAGAAITALCAYIPKRAQAHPQSHVPDAAVHP